MSKWPEARLFRRLLRLLTDDLFQHRPPELQRKKRSRDRLKSPLEVQHAPWNSRSQTNCLRRGSLESPPPHGTGCARYPVQVRFASWLPAGNRI